MAEQSKFGALAAILAKSLDDIPDLPEYKAPLPGVYKMIIDKVGPKEINDKTALVIEYAIIECVALDDPAAIAETPELASKPGDKFSEAFWFDKPENIEQTQSVLKAKYGGLGAALGTTDLLQILEQMEGKIVQGIVKNRLDKTDKTKVYASTRDLAFAV